MAITRLMCEVRLLRDQNAELVAQLERAGAFVPDASDDRLEATLPAGPGAPATARAALTRWLTGQVPGPVLADARLLASELVANTGRTGRTERTDKEESLSFAAQLRDGALRVELRGPSRSATAALGSGYGLQLVEALATRWGVDEVDGTRLWFEVAAAPPVGPAGYSTASSSAA